MTSGHCSARPRTSIFLVPAALASHLFVWLLSLAGSPERAETLDLSRRGLAEMASDNNDLLMGLDDTEKADEKELVNTLKCVVHVLPAANRRRFLAVRRNIHRFNGARSRCPAAPCQFFDWLGTTVGR